MEKLLLEVMNGNHVRLETACSWPDQTLSDAGDRGEDCLYLDCKVACSPQIHIF